MRYIKSIFEKIDEERIELLCQQYKIIDYVINSDGTVDSPMSVRLEDMNLKKLPLQFRKIGFHFSCRNNDLRSLKGSPYEAHGDFICSDNPKLKSLLYGPKKVGMGISCSGCNLYDLNGFPKKSEFDGGLDIFRNPITEIFDVILGRNCEFTDRWDMGYISHILIEYDVIQGRKVFELGLEQVYQRYKGHEISFKDIKFKNYELI